MILKRHDKASDFLSAMETIAKYGMNGMMDEKGNVTYDIKKGPMVGTPDDYLDRVDILKSKAPDLYNEINELNYKIVNRKGGEKFGTYISMLICVACGNGVSMVK